jgi:hypothetical protein
MIKIYYSLGLRYGSLAAVLSIAAFLVLQLSGQQPLLNLHMLIMDGLLFSLGLGVALKDFRDYYRGGYLTFAQGMSIGFFQLSVFAVWFALFLGLYTFLDQDFLEGYKEALIEQLAFIPEDRLDESFISEQKEKALQYRNIDLVLDGLLKKILTGFVLSPILTVIFRRMPKIDQQGN